jgi:hypothetical protein
MQHKLYYHFGRRRLVVYFSCPFRQEVGCGIPRLISEDMERRSEVGNDLANLLSCLCQWMHSRVERNYQCATDVQPLRPWDPILFPRMNKSKIVFLRARTNKSKIVFSVRSNPIIVLCSRAKRKSAVDG